MFIDNPYSDWIEGSLSDIADITMGQSPSGSSYNEDGIGTIFFQGRAEFGFRFPTIRLYTTEPKRMACANDTLMSARAPVGDINVAHTDCCIGRGLAAIHSKPTISLLCSTRCIRSKSSWMYSMAKVQFWLYQSQFAK